MPDHPGENDALSAVRVALRDLQDRGTLPFGAPLVGLGAGDRPVVVDDGFGAADFSGLGRTWGGRLGGRLSGLGESGRACKAQTRRRGRRQEASHATLQLDPVQRC